MQRKVIFPASDELLDLTTVLVFHEGSRTSRGFDVKNPAWARAVLAAPSNYDSQKLLLLPNINFVRGNPGESETRIRKDTIGFLIQNKAIRPTKDELHFYVIKHILFPNPSRCSSCISRTNTNGWKEWQFVKDGKFPVTLETAWEQAERSEFVLTFYDDLPEDTVEVPFKI